MTEEKNTNPSTGYSERIQKLVTIIRSVFIAIYENFITAIDSIATIVINSITSVVDKVTEAKTLVTGIQNLINTYNLKKNTINDPIELLQLLLVEDSYNKVIVSVLKGIGIKEDEFKFDDIYTLSSETKKENLLTLKENKNFRMAVAEIVVQIILNIDSITENAIFKEIITPILTSFGIEDIKNINNSIKTNVNRNLQHSDRLKNMFPVDEQDIISKKIIRLKEKFSTQS